MIIDASNFSFQCPPQIARAKRVLIKPDAAYSRPHPVTTRREVLGKIISGIRKVSDTDIILLEGSSEEKPMSEIYRSLSYDFPRVLMLDVDNCSYLEVENPLLHPFAIPTFWIPNIILSCDYLITVSCFKLVGGNGHFSIMNLLGLLPQAKYSTPFTKDKSVLHSYEIQRLVADLYFTLPFDLGIIDAQKTLISEGDAGQGTEGEAGKIIIGDPYEVDSEASEMAGADTEYLRLIKTGQAEL
ncbi:MAG: DUF362 domain-containing protein [Dehalococcoidia bacterium]|nr:DUF362 domain-containing protein [Dehalococcoidia bacterium]MDZ4247049.1 DUF362 domain-containing protein [Dehalococcoidia bacterium]